VATPCACIDIGSNTTRLLVAEKRDGRLHEIAAERVFTSLGAAALADDTIPTEKIAELADVVAAQVASAVRHRCAEIRVVATAAVRRAPNRVQLLAALTRVAGVEVDLLEPGEEARLTYTGALGMFAEGVDGTVAVIDVGGGSSELVVGADWWRSLPHGSSSLTRSCVTCDPPSAACISSLREAAARAFQAVQPPAADLALAVGGSATSLLLVSEDALDARSLGRALERLLAGPVAEVALTIGLHPARARVLPAGIVLLGQACEMFGGSLRVAAGGVREGVALELLEKERLGLSHAPARRDAWRR